MRGGYHALPIATLPSPVGRGGGSAGHSLAGSPAARGLVAESESKHRRRDADAARLTAFPTPGLAGSPTATAQPPKTTGYVAPRRSVPARDAPRSASMYWMPDHLCKTCYDCGASFSIFRRRHHCRLCGQIFCHACSSQFVDGTLHGFPHQLIRICKFCSRYVTADAERKQQATLALDHKRRGSLDATIAAPSPLQSATLMLPPPESTSSVKASPLLFSPVNASATPSLQDEDAHAMERISDEFVHEAHGESEFEHDAPADLVCEHETRAETSETLLPAPPPGLFAIASTESADFSDGLAEPAPVKTFRRPSLARRRRSSLEFLTSSQSGFTFSESEPSQHPDSESSASVSETAVSEQRPSFGPESDSFRIKNDCHTQREIVLDKYMKAAHERIREGIQRSADRSMKHFVGDGIEVRRLVSSLEDMAFIVTGHLLFSMNFRTPNGFNFAELVKVKSIATPIEASSNRQLTKDPYGFKWLAGCICRKQLSHKQMARKIDHPRILLLACAISYDRSADTGKMSSLDALIESEKSYMAILATKVSKLEPDIVFVERTVSRHAQELLRELGIAIVQNVKFDTLERIGRYTGATVLMSVDHVDQVDPEQVIGKCRSFYAQKVPVAAEDPSEPAAGDAAANLNGGGTPKGNVLKRGSSSRAKNETYLYLDGCDPLNGCTVLITGPTKKKLGIMKTLMRNVLSMTYRTLLEAHVLSGLALNYRDWYRHSLADQQERLAWCTTCTLRQYETVQGKLRYYQCSGSKRIGIAPYSQEDISLGNFLAKEMEALAYRCNNSKCSYTMVDHVQTFSCTLGSVTVSFEELPDSINPANGDHDGSANDSYINVLSLLGTESTATAGSNGASGAAEKDANCPTIVYGKWCSECAKMICPFAPLKKYAYKFSLARLLEILLGDSDPLSAMLVGDEHEPPPQVQLNGCSHNFMKSHVLFFNVGRIVARMDFTIRTPVRMLNTPSVVVIDGKRRRRSAAPGVLSSSSTNGNGNGNESGPAAPTSDLIAAAAARRLDMLVALLEKLVDLFADKVGDAEEAVLSCEDPDGVATEVMIEIAMMKKLIHTDAETFTQRLAAIELEPVARHRLADTDRVKRQVYFAVCGWIEEMQKLRRTIRSTLAIEPDSSIAASPFSRSGFSFSTPTPTTQSPAGSPRRGRLESPRRSRPTSKAVSLDERSRASSGNQSFLNGGSGGGGAGEETAHSLFSGSSTGVPSPPKLSKATSAQSTLGSTSSKESGWKSMLWDIYRAVGKSTPGDDLDLALPAELLEGHPSLSNRSSDCVYIVNEAEPITSVAYALGSQSYDDQLRAWKVAVQTNAAKNRSASTLAGAAAESKIELSGSDSASSSATEWTRAALTTPAHMHFKHSAVDTPRHLGLMYPSGSGSTGCWEFSTIAFFSLQFEALRELFYGSLPDFLFSISHVNNWAALGGKSGASFYRTLDDRFVVKHISSTEQQSFLDVLPSYFDYMSKVYHEQNASVISKLFGMYQTTITKKETGQRTIHHIVVMENAFYGQNISKTFDLKGSSRNRYVKPDANGKPRAVELDGNFVEMTEGHPMAVLAEDHELLLSAIDNDAAFLASINIVDFSLVLGLGGESSELPNAYTTMTVGIIDYMRQFDLMKRVESVSKSVAMIAGQSSPTIIEPALYSKRFSDAIHRYFMPVTPIDSDRNDPFLGSR